MTPRSRLKFVSALLVTLAIAASAAALAIFVPLLPTSLTGADWWKWALTQPADRSPLLDSTGANCGRGQPLLGKFYLAGTVDGSPSVTRTCSVPNGRILVIPVVNGIAAAFPSDPADQKTEAYLRGQLTGIKAATALSLTIDGTPVTNLKNYYRDSVKFSVTLPSNNIYGLPSGQKLDPAYDAGYYVNITGLLPGKHVVKWHAETDGTVQDITYNLTVNLLP